MKFIRPVDLFDVTRAIELFNQLELDLKLMDQCIVDIHQGILSAVRKEARSIAQVLIDDFDMEFVGLIDSMTKDQSLSVNFYRYDKETHHKRVQLESYEKKYSDSLQDDDHKQNARELARTLKEIASVEKDLLHYNFDAFSHYLIFIDQYGHTEPVDLLQKIQDKINGITSKRRDLQHAITISLGVEHDALWHIETYKEYKAKLNRLNKKADDIRLAVSTTNSLRVKISSLSDNISETKGVLLNKLTKQLEKDVPNLDIIELLKYCPAKLIDSFRLYYVAINQLKLLDSVMKYIYSQNILVDSERDMLKILESKMSHREIFDLTRSTRELLLTFVVHRPLIFSLDTSIRLNLIDDLVTTIQKANFSEELIDGLKVSVLSLLDQNTISFQPPNLLLLIFQGALTESDVEHIDKLPFGSINNIQNEIKVVINSFSPEWINLANIPDKAFMDFALNGLGTIYSLIDYKGYIHSQELNDPSSLWFIDSLETTPRKIKDCLGIE